MNIKQQDLRVGTHGRPCKKFARPVWSPCKIWLLFLILCARM